MREIDFAQMLVEFVDGVARRRGSEAGHETGEGSIQFRDGAFYAVGAAEILDINPSTLRSRMEKLEIKKPG
jgi:hypothetical protein